MDEIGKLMATIEAAMRKATADAFENGKQEGKREVMALLTAAAGVEQSVKRRRRRTKAEMGKA